jgi:hypothetical protein
MLTICTKVRLCYICHIVAMFRYLAMSKIGPQKYNVYICKYKYASCVFVFLFKESVSY